MAVLCEQYRYDDVAVRRCLNMFEYAQWIILLSHIHSARARRALVRTSHAR